MTTRLPDASQQAGADGVVDLVDVGTTNAEGKMRFYSGAQPADADDAASGTLLVEFDLSNPAFGAAAASGTATLQGVPIAATGAATGDAGYFRVVNRDEATVIQGDVTATGGGGDIEIDNVSIASGQTVNLTGYTYTHPAA